MSTSQNRFSDVMFRYLLNVLLMLGEVLTQYNSEGLLYVSTPGTVFDLMLPGYIAFDIEIVTELPNKELDYTSLAFTVLYIQI